MGQCGHPDQQYTGKPIVLYRLSTVDSLRESYMPLIARTSSRRKMRVWGRFRRRIQQLGPYPSLLLLFVPLATVEPLKIVALVVAGKGHWLSGAATIVAAYAMSLLFTERLFRLVKPKLLMLNWFAVIWSKVTSVWSTLQIKIGTRGEGASE